MRFPRPALFALIGVTLCSGVTWGVAQVLSPTRPVMAQVNSGVSQPPDFSDGNLNEPDSTFGSTQSDNFTPKSRSDQSRRVGQRGQKSVLRELSLTPDQMQKLKAVKQQYRGQLRDRQSSVKTARQELKSLVASSASSSAIQSKSKEVQRLQKDAKELRLQRLMATREILTPTQQQQLREKMVERRQERPKQETGSLNTPY